MVQITTTKRLRINVTGTVQGVGFRPFIFGLAKRNRLTGFVQNSSGGVEIEIQSESKAKLDEFCRSMIVELPPLAKINHWQKLEIAPVRDETDFSIHKSESSDENQNSFPIIPPSDSATCKDCLRELSDKKDRRFRYPFINCTNCGPRFTIIQELPYDRANTSMQKFAMCKLCLHEYENPLNRRFHAQPNACFDCGPQLQFEPGNLNGEPALARSIEYLKQGKIIALKGLGGFQLLCDAKNENAVKELRKRKQRPAKPLAIMVADLTEAKKYCRLDECDEIILSGVERPIVLLSMHEQHTELAQSLSHSDKLGVMLPYTPLHHLLLQDFGGPVVATSGNISEEPIACANQEAMDELKNIADGFLVHDRDIISRYDDSVSSIYSGKENRVRFLRRARGYAPACVSLPFTCKQNILALGGHLKNTFSFGRGNQAIMSQHLGDLDNSKNIDNYKDVLNLYQKMFRFKPQIIVHDLHPDYYSSIFAEQMSQDLNIETIQVQHHHAHIAACMVEHNLESQVIGVAFDGLGIGDDETLWGGEFLFCRYDSFSRFAHFKPAPMPGGSIAIKQPWRMMLGLIHTFNNKGKLESFIEKTENRFGKKNIQIIQKQLENSFNSPLTSSCGRIFDAVSALLGICLLQDYEGQAPVELETLARTCINCETESYNYEVENKKPYLINSEPFFLQIVQDMERDLSKNIIAYKFHQTIKAIVVDLCLKIRQETQCSTVCLSGGVFQNQLLSQLVEQELMQSGFSVYLPAAIPPNDGGLSLGQLSVASHLI